LSVKFSLLSRLRAVRAFERRASGSFVEKISTKTVEGLEIGADVDYNK
jgi:hypothetical protein